MSWLVSGSSKALQTLFQACVIDFDAFLFFIKTYSTLFSFFPTYLLIGIIESFVTDNSGE